MGHQRSIPYVHCHQVTIFLFSKAKDSNGKLMLMLCRSVCSWALLVGGALLALMILGPFVLSMDRSEMTKTIVNSKG